MMRGNSLLAYNNFVFCTEGKVNDDNGSRLVCKMACTVLPAKSDSVAMFCLQSYQGLIIDRTLVY